MARRIGPRAGRLRASFFVAQDSETWQATYCTCGGYQKSYRIIARQHVGEMRWSSEENADIPAASVRTWNVRCAASSAAQPEAAEGVEAARFKAANKR